uniref:Protein G12 n=1 Tax=Glossina brevipalpis TaxID=37001 RepID=A0A1A9WR60_9MUSC
MRENREYICFVLCVLLGCWCKIISTYPQSVTESSNKNNSNNKNYNNNNNILALNFNDKSNATAYDDRRNVGVVEIITKAEKIHFSQINENENFSGILENALNAQLFQQIDLLTSTSATSTPSLSSSLSSSLSLASALATSVLERDSLTTASVTLPTNMKRAYSFMSSSEFTRLKEHIIAVPEMSAFLRYLNNSGLDLVKFVNAIANLTNGIDDVSSTSYQNDNNELMANHGVVTKKSDIEFELNLNSSVTLKAYEANKTITSTETGSIFTESSTTGEMVLTTTEEHFSGLHGLVDSVLEALPQDQILATFFDKLETSEEFSKLFDDIGSPPFAKILENMENSMPLRHLIFTLHNNGIYIMKMVDSLKSYFFLGTF